MKALPTGALFAAGALMVVLFASAIVGRPWSSTADVASYSELDEIAAASGMPESHGGQLTLSNIGSSGKDGVSIDLRPAHLGAMTLREVAASEQPVLLGVMSLASPGGAVTITEASVPDGVYVVAARPSPLRPKDEIMVILYPAPGGPPADPVFAFRDIPIDRLDSIVAPGGSFQESHICIGIHIQNDSDICIGVHIDG